MASKREVRVCAVQALYQLDVGNADSPEHMQQSLADSPGGGETHQLGVELATKAWGKRAEADAAVAALTPEWPTHRQPIVDRCILRLAYYEMISGETPPKVAINEAVELAKELSTEKSPMFINGVLDKIYRAMRQKTGANGA